MGYEGLDSRATTFALRLIVAPFQGLGMSGVSVPMGFTHRYDMAPLRGFCGDARAFEGSSLYQVAI